MPTYSPPPPPTIEELMDSDFNSVYRQVAPKRPISEISHTRLQPPAPDEDPNPPDRLRHERTIYHNDPLYDQAVPLDEQMASRNYHAGKRTKGPAHEEHIIDSDIRNKSFRDIFDDDDL
jgi:hypothetical protein